MLLELLVVSLFSDNTFSLARVCLLSLRDIAKQQRKKQIRKINKIAFHLSKYYKQIKLSAAKDQFEDAVQNYVSKTSLITQKYANILAYYLPSVCKSNFLCIKP